jgi:predicted ABC-type exoprotein transport system permease subunit
LVVSKFFAPRVFVLSGILLFFSGVLYLRAVAQNNQDSLMLFYTWISIQTVSYILALIGFTRMFMRQTDKLNELREQSKAKTNLSRLALLSIIAGLTLTFPLLQTSLPLPIATLAVAAGLVLMGLSLVFWMVSIFFFTKAPRGEEWVKREDL